MYLKTCHRCGKEFETRYYQQKYCSIICREVADSLKRYETVPEAVMCKCCGFKALDLNKHITAYHGSIEDYCQKFNINRSELRSPPSVENYRKAQKELTLSGRGNRFTSTNNPSHEAECKNGRNSPYSMNFRKYDGLSDDEKRRIIEERKRANVENMNKRCNNSKRIDYYTSRGYTEEEAKKLLKESQSTFSLEKCIQRYGEAEGKLRWNERQEKWLNNYHKQNFSWVSQRLFWSIYDKIKDKYSDIYFATLDENKSEDKSGTNHEFTLQLPNRSIKPDFIIVSEKKIIEFDGSYWHGSENAKEKDLAKQQELESFGYCVYHVNENPETVLVKCLEYIDTK